MIGALGSIASTVILGAVLMRKGLARPTGMITEKDPFDQLDLCPVEDLEFGGFDIRDGTFPSNVRRTLDQFPGLDRNLPDRVARELAEVDSEIRKGTVVNCGEAIASLASDPSPRACASLTEEVERLRACLRDFKERRGLAEVVVVNLASTEPPLETAMGHADRASLEKCLRSDSRESVRASTLYAYAAIGEGFPYVNFTPSSGALTPGMIDLAKDCGTPVMGNDGKTGETLIKSTLAPMFHDRNLEILSWEGFNLLGNMDGRVLRHPENRKSKIETKDHLLPKILGYSPHSRVHIDYVPSLEDQKTAWDFIHFRGFLDARMSLQFIWQGYDSLLAAPLVLDLVRWAEYAKRNGESGLMPHLASYFKAPVGVAQHRFHAQYQMLLDYARQRMNPTS